MAALKRSRVGKRWVIAQVLAIKTILALERVLMSMFRSSRAITFRFDGRPQWQMFLLFHGRDVGPHLDGHQHGVSIQSSINLGAAETLFPITREWITAKTEILARSFIYRSSFISQLLDLIYWMVTNFIFDGVTLQTSHEASTWRENMLGHYLLREANSSFVSFKLRWFQCLFRSSSVQYLTASNTYFPLTKSRNNHSIRTIL